MAFDECPPYPCDYNYAKDSMALTHRWLDMKAMTHNRHLSATSLSYQIMKFIFLFQ